MNPLDALKKLSSMVNTAENMVLKKDMSELYKSFQELNDKCNELREKNLDLKEEISKLKENNKILEQELEKELQRKESVFLNDGAYWTKEGKGPYCSVCYEKDGILITTFKKPGYTKMKCPSCTHEYSTSQQEKESKEVQDRLYKAIWDDDNEY